MNLHRLKPPWPVDTFAIWSGLVILAIGLAFEIAGKDGMALFYMILGLANLCMGSWARERRERRENGTKP